MIVTRPQRRLPCTVNELHQVCLKRVSSTAWSNVQQQYTGFSSRARGYFCFSCFSLEFATYWNLPVEAGKVYLLGKDPYLLGSCSGILYNVLIWTALWGCDPAIRLPPTAWRGKITCFFNIGLVGCYLSSEYAIKSFSCLFLHLRPQLKGQDIFPSF